MSQPSAVTAWKAVLRLLQGLAAHSTFEQKAAVCIAVQPHLNVLRQAFVPRATWKQLIRNMQVPLHLGTACGDAQLGRPVAWEALSVLLATLIRDCGVVESSTLRVNVEKASAQPLMQAALAQLQQSRVLQQLPATMQRGAQLLQAAGIKAPPATAAAPSSSSSRLLSNQSFATEMLAVCRTLIVLSSSVYALQLPDSDRFSLCTACAHLALAIFQHASTLLDSPQYPPGSLPSDDVLPSELLCLAFSELGSISHDLNKQPDTALTESPEVQEALSLLVFVMHCHTLLPERAQQAAHAATAGGRGSTRPVSRGGRDSSSIEALKQWGQFNWRLGVQGSDPAGRVDDMCLCSTGVSVRAAALIAACVPAEDAGWAVKVAQVAARALVIRTMTDTARLRKMQPQLPPDVKVQLQHDARHALVLSQVHLCTVARRSSAPTFVSECCAAAKLALGAGSAVAGVHTPEEEPQQLSEVLSAWFEPLVPTVLQLMSSIVHQLQGARAAAAEAAGNCNAPSHASTSPSTTSNRAAAASSSSSSAISSSNTRLAAEAPHTAVPPLVRLLCLVSEFTTAPRLESSGRVVVRCWAWHKYDAQLAGMLDGLVRGSLKFVGSPQDLAGIAGDLSESLLSVATMLVAADRLGPVPVAAAGRPSDTMEQQIFALCVSLHKAAVVLDVVGQAETAAVCRGCCVWSGRAVVVEEAEAAAFATSTHSGTDATAATAAVAVLPWLVLIGRSCLHWASEVQQLQQSRPDLGKQLVHLQRSGPVSAEELSRALKVSQLHGLVAALGVDARLGGTLAASTAAAIKAWVGGRSRVQVLGDLGYPAGDTVQALEAVLASVVDTQAAASPAAATATLGQLAERLLELGRVLNTLAIPHVCNNAGCANLAGVTETEMVSGRSCICAGCRVARYCGRSCQTAAWRQHKPVCKALAAAGAAEKLLRP